MEISEQDVATHWDRNADLWADQVRRGLDAYREAFNNPAFLNFLGPVEGKTLLDAGCGEGYNTRILAKQGASMTGIDISPRMIELARAHEEAEPLGIRYEVGSFSNLRLFGAGAFDAAVSFMALMDGPDFSAAVRETHRVLRPAGELVFSLTHPCFMTKGYRWLRDQEGSEVGLVVGEYFREEPWLEQWRFKEVGPEAGPFLVPRFPMTLSSYLNAVIDAGFSLRRIDEPRPSEEACQRHPWLRRWRQHAAVFLYIRAQKA